MKFPLTSELASSSVLHKNVSGVEIMIVVYDNDASNDDKNCFRISVLILRLGGVYNKCVCDGRFSCLQIIIKPFLASLSHWFQSLKFPFLSSVDRSGWLSLAKAEISLPLSVSFHHLVQYVNRR